MTYRFFLCLCACVYSKDQLDALLGDYPILDYARAHLAPSCELKLISKIFGDDIYGLGLPKKSPLKAALSKKISEYHRMGYIDDLIDVHFADAHCFKRRISEEDSQLEVAHHAGLFVMMCVGVGIGILVLLLEHVTYKFLVPYIRNCPMDSAWRSTHLMFFSQRLQRTINCVELISPQQSAKEIMGIFKKREFVRLFQKSTIRRNRLADIAKTKRINRNFHDIVEKAKWLQEMKESGLMDDDTPSTPTIIEIPLRQLTANVELGSSSLKLNCQDGDSALSSPVRRPSQLAAALRAEMGRERLGDGDGEEHDAQANVAAMLPCRAAAILETVAVEEGLARARGCGEGSSDESGSVGSGDSLLGDVRVPSEKSLSNLLRPASSVLTINDEDNENDSASSSSSTFHHSRLRRPSRERHRRRQQQPPQQQQHRHYKPQQHRKATITSSSPEIDFAPDTWYPGTEGGVLSKVLNKRMRSMSVDHTLPQSSALLNTSPKNKRPARRTASSSTASSLLPSASLVNELPSGRRLKHQPCSIAVSSPSHNKHKHRGSVNSSCLGQGLPYSEPLPNGRTFDTSSILSHPFQGDENDGDVEDVDEQHDDNEDDNDDGKENITVRLNFNLSGQYDAIMSYNHTPSVFPGNGEGESNQECFFPDPLPNHAHVQHQNNLTDHVKVSESENVSSAGAGASASSNFLSLRSPSSIYRKISSEDQQRRLHHRVDLCSARSLLRNAGSYQDQPSQEAAAEPSPPGPAFSLDSVSKEELLVLWKTSEMDLSQRLEEALLEKARLERRLALLQKHSPV
ncbi:glutamate receptor ionotropic, nmda 3a [Plakobranchus ocellatus]|uniref:Glutamate receptor ionotropic, nmda 3a n=1 Tax=Plakobranchus ocellatus TaxID=259542 RepID=A0AAV4D716_9GAST|nr:glutamate receptor ionotropic, nmda 3a [Plakobranchus ocellatus]